jgi:predicted LPLAT superfamily acyltransferase
MESALQWDGKYKGSALGTRIFLKIVLLFGLFPAYCLLVPVSLYFVFQEKKSRRAIAFFRSHLGLSTTFFHYWRHFFSFGMTILDRYGFLLQSKTPFSFIAINEENIVNALAEGKGAILLSAHVGNWEIAGNQLYDRIQKPIHLAMIDAEKPEIRNIFAKALKKRRISIIPINQDGIGFMTEIVNALRRNEIICMHGDRMFGKKGDAALFLNAPVMFPRGPFAIAAATGAPIIPIFTYKKGLKQYIFHTFERIDVKGSEDGRITEGLNTYVHFLEQVVKENPYEWFNFYDFWEDEKAGTPPKSPAGGLL